MLRKLVGSLLVAVLLGAVPTVAPLGPPPAAAAPDGDGYRHVAAAAPASVAQVAAGAYYTCALLDDGRVKCWGFNGFGALGLGDTVERGDGPGEMGDRLPTVGLGTSRTGTQIAAGYAHTCALLDDGTVKCWGANTDGRLGLGDTDNRGDGPGEMGDALPAVPLGTGRTATQIAAGDYHTCAVLDDATIKCWGNNGGGQLGLGDTADRGDGPGEMGDALPTVPLGTGRTATQLTAGEAHTCALLDDGTVKCWGANSNGQLGLGDTTRRGDGPGEMGDALPTVPLGTGRTATQLTAGEAHTCALLDDGTVKCWGASYDGALGLGDLNHRGDGPGEMGDALPTVALGTGRTATQISASRGHTCAGLDNGAVICWGNNTFGQLGLGDTDNRGDEPGEMGDALPTVALGTGRTATQIVPGEYHTCAVLDDATTKCWGNNGGGQLGLGDTADRGDEPGEMGDALPVVELSDTSDPIVTLVTPAHGAVYGHGQPVTADYTCADTSGTGIDTCVGDVAEGAHIDTATLGDQPFSVSATDHAGHETVVTHTYAVADPRPDGWVKLGAAGTYKGDDRYNTTALGQTARGQAAPGRTVTYFVTVQNDAPLADVLSLRGTASNDRFRVTYTALGEDITAQVTEGDYSTPVLAPAERHLVKVTVKVKAGAPSGSSLAGTVTARSLIDLTARDRVGFTTQRA